MQTLQFANPMKMLCLCYAKAMQSLCKRCAKAMQNRGCVTTGATGAMAPVKFWDSLVKGYVEGKNWCVDWSLAPVLVDF